MASESRAKCERKDGCVAQVSPCNVTRERFSKTVSFIVHFLKSWASRRGKEWTSGREDGLLRHLGPSGCGSSRQEVALRGKNGQWHFNKHWHRFQLLNCRTQIILWHTITLGLFFSLSLPPQTLFTIYWTLCTYCVSWRTNNKILFSFHQSVFFFSGQTSE